MRLPEFVRDVGPATWARRMFWRQFTKRILRRDQCVRLPTGLKMTLPRQNQFGSEVYVTGCSVDWGTEALFCSMLSAEGDLIDVGANIGYYTLYCLPRVRAVYAFEPDPRVWAWLGANVAAHPNVRIFQTALGSFAHRGHLLLGPTPQQSRLENPRSTTTGSSISVAVTTIDEVADRHGLRPTGIKIDVEGMDLDVVRGGVATLAAHQPLVILETRSTAELSALIQPLDYTAFGFVRDAATDQFRLRQLPPDPTLHTKMIFLVPRRLHDRFAAIVSQL